VRPPEIKYVRVLNASAFGVSGYALVEGAPATAVLAEALVNFESEGSQVKVGGGRVESAAMRRNPEEEEEEGEEGGGHDEDAM
jgi:hypothetical protein